MIKTFFESYSYVTVAVALDEHSVPLARLAAQLARQAGKNLCLLHIVEPWVSLPQSKPFGERSTLWDATQAVERNAFELAQKRLDELAALVADDLVVKVVIGTGKSAEQLGKEAETVGSCVLLIGADYSKMRFLPRGFSTALSLMVSAPMPVLVVDTQTSHLKMDGAVVLLADDLSADAERAVSFAFDFAQAAKGHVRHLHVSGLTPEELRAGLQSASASAHSPIDVESSASEIYGLLERRVYEELQSRTDPYREYLEAVGGTYQCFVRTGGVQEELAKTIEIEQPDLLVFGRHRAVHARPFHFGRLPFRAVLGHRLPVVIVPGP